MPAQFRFMPACGDSCRASGAAIAHTPGTFIMPGLEMRIIYSMCVPATRVVDIFQARVLTDGMPELGSITATITGKTR